ncbi:MAG: hypothetical protein OXI55_00780 [Gammaproteobacteria bacterium]|nr:hypothetical protein [Gammaproteobacteria bacterium]
MTSEVATWQPAPQQLGAAHVQALERAAEAQNDTLDLDEQDTVLLRELMAANLDQWQALVDATPSTALAKWLRVVVLAEMRLPGCERGAKSPAILMARALRARNAYPKELTAWIRSVSDNRFLPYGSLLDRL